VILKA